MSELQLIYASASGASIIRSLPHDRNRIADAMNRLRRRHIEARLVCNGKQIGKVYQRDGWHYLFDPLYIRN